MKGVVFSELTEMVEDLFGYEMLEQTLEKADLPHEGLYVSGGTYPHSELVKIVVALSEVSGTPVPDLLRAYGKHLFGRLTSMYPTLLETADNPLDFIERVDGIIHVEVRKLYPDAELPVFRTINRKKNELKLEYESAREMEIFGIGLMEGCAKHYGKELIISTEPVPDREVYTVLFTISVKE